MARHREEIQFRVPSLKILDETGRQRDLYNREFVAVRKRQIRHKEKGYGLRRRKEDTCNAYSTQSKRRPHRLREVHGTEEEDAGPEVVQGGRILNVSGRLGVSTGPHKGLDREEGEVEQKDESI